MKKYILVSFALALLVFCSLYAPLDNRAGSYHSDRDLKVFREHVAAAPPIPEGEFFLVPSECKGCHGFDPQGIANVDAQGKDINLFDDWLTSMMGMAGVDPLWRAKVRQEIMVNPSNANELQTLCTSCHAPMGHYTAMYKGHPYYTLDDLASDSLGLSGVACGGCHSIGLNGLGSMFTGNIPYDTNNVEYGPFQNPYTGPMQLYVGLIPTYSTHVSEGKFCSPCHTLITSTVDLNGTPTGGKYVEQATYHEWLNSIYPGADKTCQICHMPQVEDPVKIAVGYLGLEGRAPFNQHTFAGANRFMVQLIKDNKQAIGYNAQDSLFDETIRNITQMLRTKTVQLQTSTELIADDTAYIAVKLTNLAGHKFPSGYPARRAFVQMIVKSDAGDTLFASGKYNQAGEVIDRDLPYEPHYDIITSQDQVQMYELIMGDVNGDRTTMLERAAYSLKDNRLTPKGFTTAHSVYDTVQIVGVSAADTDFNRDGPVEGTGSDVVHYHIPLNGYRGYIHVYTKVYYQSVPPDWLTEMFSLSATEIDFFKSMYMAADKSPDLVATDSLKDILISLNAGSVKSEQDILVAPNPTSDFRISILTGNQVVLELSIIDLNGKIVRANNMNNIPGKVEVDLPGKGVYMLKIRTAKGVYYRKVLSI